MATAGPRFNYPEGLGAELCARGNRLLDKETWEEKGTKDGMKLRVRHDKSGPALVCGIAIFPGRERTFEKNDKKKKKMKGIIVLSIFFPPLLSFSFFLFLFILLC
jgi:hypothetical protein